MKRLLWAVLVVALFVTPVFALSDEEQNAGFVPFTGSVTLTVRSDAPTYIYREAPASSTTWVANHPNSSYVVLPPGCRGFQVNAFANDIIVNHPNNIATGAVYVGKKIASGSYLEWRELDLDQRTLGFALLSNSTTNATMTICGW